VPANGRKSIASSKRIVGVSSAHGGSSAECHRLVAKVSANPSCQFHWILIALKPIQLALSRILLVHSIVWKIGKK